MNKVRVPIPEASPIHLACAGGPSTDNHDGLVLDFDNLAAPTSIHFSQWSLATDHSSFIIKCDFPSAFILDVVFFIVHYSGHAKIFLSTREITREGLRLFRRLGVAGLSNERKEPQDLSDRSRSSVFGNPIGDNAFEKIANLTSTEISILYYISLGLSNGQISDLVSRSYHTIKNHKVNIAEKVGLEGCSQLYEFIQKLKVVSV